LSVSFINRPSEQRLARFATARRLAGDCDARILPIGGGATEALLEEVAKPS
jgi:hypothetical protein